MKTILRSTLGALVALLPALALSEVPSAIPIQGVLASPSGAPLDGTYTATFSLYDAATGGTPFHTETQAIVAQGGAFTAYLAPDLAEFRSRAAWLGIRVNTDPEMTPRLRIGTVPYAAHSATTDAVPAGAVMYFDLAACPAGWAPLADAAGRVIAGVPSGGTRGRTVGSPLADGESRNHAHALDLPASNTAVAVNHAHVVDPPVVGTTGDSHNHIWSIFNSGGSQAWQTYGASGGIVTMIDWGDGMDSNGSGHYPAGFDSGTPVTLNYTSADTHGHTVDLPATSSTFGGAHDHSYNPPLTTSQVVNGHLPYLQLLVCRKN